MTPTSADLEVFASPLEVAAAAAHRFAAAAEAAIAVRGEFLVALSGGATPRAMYAELARQPLAPRVNWSRVQLLWGDERCVPPTDPGSNYRMAREALLDHVPVREEHVHRVHGEDESVAEARRYEGVLRRLLKTPTGPPRRVRLDLVLLGLGEDGHTASLFPGATAVHDADAWAMAARAPVAPFPRVTLTPAILNASGEVVFMVTGTAKAAIVQRVLEGPATPHDLPAQLIAPSGGSAHWLLDAAAARSLSAASTHAGREARP